MTEGKQASWGFYQETLKQYSLLCNNADNLGIYVRSGIYFDKENKNLIRLYKNTLLQIVFHWNQLITDKKDPELGIDKIKEIVKQIEIIDKIYSELISKVNELKYNDKRVPTRILNNKDNERTKLIQKLTDLHQFILIVKQKLNLGLKQEAHMNNNTIENQAFG